MASWGSAATPSSRTAVVREVHIDGLAVLKIVKHCKDALPNKVTGALMGLDQKGAVEVTHSFASVPTEQSLAKAEAMGDHSGHELEQDQKFMHDMMKALKEVNVDSNLVGWYQTMLLGTFNHLKLIQDLQTYQENLPNSVAILYDPVQTATGSLCLRAFRLSDRFLEVSARGLNEFLPPSQVLVELPVKIRNPGLVSALLFDLRGAKSSLGCDFERLDLSTNPYLEKNLEYLCVWVDDLTKEQYAFGQKIKHDKWHAKQRAQGFLSEEDAAAADSAVGIPDRMTSLLVSNQIDQYCSQVHQFAGAGFGKLFLAGQLQGKTTA